MQIVRGNYGYDINFTARDKNDTAVDLTGVVKVIFNIADIQNNRNLLSEECAEVDYSIGEVKYTVQSEEVLMKAGVYIGSLQLQYSDKVIDTKEFYVTVKEKLSI